MAFEDQPVEDVERLSARTLIRDCMYRFCHAIDRRRWDLMASVFHDDAMACGTVPPQRHWREFVKRESVRLEPIGNTHHLLGNIAMTFDGACDGAEVESYVTAFHHIPADAPPGGPIGGTGEAYDAVLCGRYVDRFEQRSGEWRIVDHRSIIDVPEYRPGEPAAVQREPAHENSSIKVVERWVA